MAIRMVDQQTDHLSRAQSRLEEISILLGSVESSGFGTDDWLEVRAQVGVLMAGFNDSLLAVDRLHLTGGAAAKILRLFQLRLGGTVSKDELSGVAGIHAWARRVRELRQDSGWDIQSVTTGPGLSPGEYRLRQSKPDPDLAANWTAAREMKKLRTSGGLATTKMRILAFLREIHPRTGDFEQLICVAGSKQKAEAALADLAADGWQVVSDASGANLRATERS